MTREEFYSSERGESSDYVESTELSTDPQVSVPLTRSGFETLCVLATDNENLILDDGIRSLVAGYLHHVPSNQVEFSLGDLRAVVYKTLSNNMTFQIDQECKARAKAEFDKAQLELAREEPSSVVPIR